MWIVWSLLILVGFCLVLSMAEDVPPMFRAEGRERAVVRRIPGARVGSRRAVGARVEAPSSEKTAV
jgi:hypothetical protein